MSGGSPTRARHPQRGFTLVELACVIVILGVAAAVAGPRFFDNDVFTERGYVDEIAAATRYVQRIAIASGCEARITINAAGYNASQRAPLGTTCDPAGAWIIAVNRPDGTALASATPAGVAVNPAIQIVFNTNGQVINGNPPPLTVGPFTLTVAVQTGMVTVQ